VFMRSYDSVYDIEQKRIGLIGSALTSRENIYFQRSTNTWLIVVLCLAGVCFLLTIGLLIKKKVFDKSKLSNNESNNRSKQYEVKNDKTNQKDS
jgi:arginine exporter protein ArgO